MRIKLVITFFFRVVGVLALLLMNLVVTNNLSVHDSGYFFIVFNFILVFSPLCLFGLEVANLRFIPLLSCGEEWGKIRGIIFFSWTFIVLTSTLVSFFLFYISPWIANEIFKEVKLVSLFQVASLSLGLVAGTKLIAHQLQALHYTVGSIILLSIFLPAGVSIIFLLNNQVTLDSIMKFIPYISLVALVVGMLYLILVVPNEKIDFSSVNNMRNTILSLWVITILTSIMRWSGVFIAGAWVTPEEVAYLNIAQRTSAIVSFILIVVNLFAAPIFSVLHTQNDYLELEKLAIKVTRLMVFFSLPVTLILIVFSNSILSIFGSEYSDANILLTIFVVGQFVTTALGPTSYLLMMSGYEQDMRNILLFSVFLMIVLTTLLTIFTGVIGAAIAITASIILQQLITAWYVNKRIGICPFLIWKEV